MDSVENDPKVKHNFKNSYKKAIIVELTFIAQEVHSQKAVTGSTIM